MKQTLSKDPLNRVGLRECLAIHVIYHQHQRLISCMLMHPYKLQSEIQTTQNQYSSSANVTLNLVYPPHDLGWAKPKS